MSTAANSTALSLFGAYLVRLPLFAVWLVGIVATLNRSKQLPRAVPLILIAMAIMIVETVVGVYLDYSLPTLLQRNLSLGVAQAIRGALAVLRSTVQAVAWGLVIAAALGRIVRPFTKE